MATVDLVVVLVLIWVSAWHFHPHYAWVSSRFTQEVGYEEEAALEQLQEMAHPPLLFG